MKACLSEIAEFITDGTHGSPERTEIGIPVLSAQNVTGGSLSYSTGRYTSEVEYQAFKKRLDIAIGDVLLTIVGSIGRAAVVSEKRPAVFQRSVAVIRPKQQVADSAYLLHLFHSSYFQSELYRNSNQSSQAGVYLGRLGSIEIPLPPLEEQRRIAAILDKANDIHNLAAEKARTCAAALYRSVLTQELDKPGMEWAQIGDVLEIARGGSPRPIQAYLTDDPDGINWIMIGDAGVGEKYITKTAKKIRAEGQSKTRLVKEGDLLLSNSMSFGRPYIMKTNGAIHDGWLVLRDAHATCNSDYLYHVLGSPTCFAQFARAAAGATVKNLNTSIVSSVEIPLPPLERQVEIAERLDAVEFHVGRKFASLAQIAEQLRSSLTSSLIQGFS
jgi:type I restriction enzyme S subunit